MLGAGPPWCCLVWRDAAGRRRRPRVARGPGGTGRARDRDVGRGIPGCGSPPHRQAERGADHRNQSRPDTARQSGGSLVVGAGRFGPPSARGCSGGDRGGGVTSDPRFRRTKIVATLGPATANPAALGALLDAGMDIVRVNSSHGTPAIRAEWMDLVRRVREERGGHIGLLVDLQGPRIRVGALAEPRMLEEGEEVVFAPEGEAQTGEIPTTYVALADDVKPGARILLD